MDVLANDSTNFGNNNGMSLTSIKLYNPAGEEVTQYDDGMATYRIVDVPGKNRKGIEITTRAKEGFAPTLSYAAIRSDGTVSSKGAVTTLIGSTTYKAIAMANTRSEKGEPAVQPTNPDAVATEKGDPETTPENPEYTGGANGTEPATNEDKPEGTTTTENKNTQAPTNNTNETPTTTETTNKPTLIKGGHEQPTNTNTLWATAAGAITALAGALHLSRKKRKS